MGENGEGEMLDRTERAPACPCHFPRVDKFDRRAFVEEEEEEEEEEDDGERNHDNNNNSSSSNGSSSLLVSPKEICSTLQRGQALQTLLYLETIDGEIEEVEREVALLSPLVQREVLRHSRGGSRNNPAVLPKQVSPGALKLILDYCRFHRVPGRSDKERKVFDEKFVRLDTRRLCELTSAADSLDMKPLGDLTSRALARMIEGKTPEQIREIFHLPDDLTEEEKLEPVKISTDDPRIRLLNRLYARKRKELQEKKLLKSGLMESGQKQVRDERSVEDLVSFIDGENKNNRLGKGKRKKNRRKKETTEENSMSRPRTDASRAAVNEKLEKEKAVQLSTMGRTASRAGGGLENSIRIVSKVQDKVFEEAEFDDDDDDDFDPALKEIVDREVEDFARRLNSDWLNSDWLNSDWLKRTQEILTLASSSQEHRISELSGTSNSAASNVGDRETSFYKEGHMGNGHTVCSLPKDKRIIQL
ncbi:unnamed protein product [Sphagnum jensenii]|uniref:SKP1 component dimerisation domain-containing protein n=1 Tax=Sphagnum jensenii TaxID=128206 RepID=A0ABP1A7M4_9BRYO